MSADDALVQRAAEAVMQSLLDNGGINPKTHTVWTDWRPEAIAVIDAVGPALIEQGRKAGRVEALEEVTREWQFGGWTILTPPLTPGGIPSLDLGQRVTDWLRDRADREEAATTTETGLGATNGPGADSEAPGKEIEP